MKKIFTLLFSVTIFASAFAQRDDRDRAMRNQQNNPYIQGYPNNGVYNQRNDRDRDDRFNNERYNNNQGYAQRDAQIANINRQIDFQIQQIAYDRYMNRWEKRRAIQNLQAQKAQQIQACNSQYNNTYNRGYDAQRGGYDSQRGGYSRNDNRNNQTWNNQTWNNQNSNNQNRNNQNSNNQSWNR